MTFYAIVGAIALVAIIAFLALCFRVVVPTNAVHIVQSAKSSKPYGKDMGSNTYYKWPAWIPGLGVRVSVLPLSVFRVELENYAAYDKGRLPFVLDVLAFFRIGDPAKAAERLSSIAELDGQLQGIMQGVVRTILANAEIEDILGKRAEFSEAFTKEVEAQLPQWGIETVKNIELMDIRDGQGSQVIQQIMAKKKSEIEKESRVAVAGNTQIAQTAEIEAAKQIQLKQQDQAQLVGERTATQKQAVGIAQQKAEQAIQEETALTTTKVMAVKNVEVQRAAEIERDAQIVTAGKNKQIMILAAEGQLEAAKRSAEGIQVQGLAKAEAEKAMQLAPVQAQITLAKEIGENQGYQGYLVSLREIEARQAVGIEQAKSMEKADIKIIANSSSPGDGLTKVMDLFTPKGGAAVGAAIEAFRNTDAGRTVANVINGSGHA